MLQMNACTKGVVCHSVTEIMLISHQLSQETSLPGSPDRMQEPSSRIIVLDDIGLRFIVNRLRFISRRGSQAAVVSELLPWLIDWRDR